MELVDDEVIGLADQGLGILDADDVCLRERAESLVVGSEVDLVSALDHLDELAEDRLPVFSCLPEDLGPLLRLSPLLGYDDLAASFIELQYGDGYLISELGQFHEFVYRDLAFTLIADIN